MSYQLVLPLLNAANYSAEAWVNDIGNNEAVSWVEHWPQWPWPRFVCFYGQPGSGKTHLGHVWTKRTQGIYLTASQALEQNPYHWVRAEKPITIDNAENLNNEEWLFQFYNIIQEAQGYVLLIARNAPTYWSTSLPDLRSRLQTIISVEIQHPEDHALQNILLKLFHERGLNVKAEAIEYLLKHCERSFSAIHKWVNQLDKIAASKGRAITIPLIREVLERTIW